MIPLKQLLEELQLLAIIGDISTKMCSGLSCNPYPVIQGDLFFCIKNKIEDGHDYIDQAIKHGAVAIVCEQLPNKLNSDIAYIVVEDTKTTMANAAAIYYGNPSEKLKLVGVTGTNGKTTIATLLYELYSKMGYKAGLISTIDYRVGDNKKVSHATTPNPIILNQLFRDMVNSGCEYCFMEITSHSLANKYLHGLEFKIAVFTNLTQDHLDYHGTFDEYLKCKKVLFDVLPKHSFALVNKDDPNCEKIICDTNAQVFYYSLQQKADYNLNILNVQLNRMTIDFNSHVVDTKLIGLFNAYNILATLGTTMLLNANQNNILQLLPELNPIKGRLEQVHSKNNIIAFVDYAHTPDALEKVLKTIKSIINPTQKLICVCGCGGNRDKSKRPLMGNIATKYADVTVFTSDNPRTECAENIIHDMISGVCDTANFLCVSDRRQAINKAVNMAKDHDVIIVTGKGHETYQIIGNRRTHFNDVEEIKTAFENLKQNN